MRLSDLVLPHTQMTCTQKTWLSRLSLTCKASCHAHLPGAAAAGAVRLPGGAAAVGGGAGGAAAAGGGGGGGGADQVGRGRPLPSPGFAKEGLAVAAGWLNLCGHGYGAVEHAPACQRDCGTAVRDDILVNP